jgi:hypothetical protein
MPLTLFVFFESLLRRLYARVGPRLLAEYKEGYVLSTMILLMAVAHRGIELRTATRELAHRRCDGVGYT